MEKENKSNREESLNNDIIPKVTGIGGIFVSTKPTTYLINIC